MVSPHLKTTFIKMVRKYLLGLTGPPGERWKGGEFRADVKKLGYEVTSTTDGAPAWKEALQEIWTNEEEDSIILFCYSPYATIPYDLKFIEEFTKHTYQQPDWTGSEEWKTKMTKVWNEDKKRIVGVKIGIDRMGYEETSVPVREDVAWKGFIDWAGMNATGDRLNTNIKGGWICRKPIMIPEPYNLTLPPRMVKNLKEAMKELKPTL